jgi:hypothetical protein
MKTIWISKWVAAAVMLGAFETFAQVNLPIGNLAPGEKVTITFDVTITNPFPAGVYSVTNQGTVSGGNFSAINTDDPQTGPVGDATVTFVEVAPAVITLAASGITPTSVVLNGSINPNNLATVNWFQFGPTTNYGSFSGTNSLAATNVFISANAAIANLTPGTLYHFQAAATNNGGTTLGSDLSFTTVAIPPPQLSNLTKTNGGPFQFAFTNAAGQTFSVLAASNVALPVNNWTLLGPAVEGPAGQYKFSDPQAGTNSQRYYRVRWP